LHGRTAKIQKRLDCFELGLTLRAQYHMTVSRKPLRMAHAYSFTCGARYVSLSVCVFNTAAAFGRIFDVKCTPVVQSSRKSAFFNIVSSVLIFSSPETLLMASPSNSDLPAENLKTQYINGTPGKGCGIIFFGKTALGLCQRCIFLDSLDPTTEQYKLALVHFCLSSILIINQCRLFLRLSFSA
jgi:hypothetical protein